MDQAVDNIPSRRRATAEAWVRPLAFWTFAILAVALCAAVEICPRLVVHQRLVRQRDLQAAENAALLQGNEQLARQIEALDNDPFYVEQVARRDMGFYRPGETRLLMGKLYTPAPPRRELPPEPWPWLVRLERLFTYDKNTRQAALVTAAVLLVCACACFGAGAPRRDQPVPTVRPAPESDIEPMRLSRRKAG